MSVDRDPMQMFNADALARQNMDPVLRDILEKYETQLQFAEAIKGDKKLSDLEIKSIVDSVPGAHEAIAVFRNLFDEYKKK